MATQTSSYIHTPRYDEDSDCSPRVSEDSTSSNCVSSVYSSDTDDN